MQSAADVQRVAGPAGDAGGFATTISALRITVTVRDGRTEFRLSRGGGTARRRYDGAEDRYQSRDDTAAAKSAADAEKREAAAAALRAQAEKKAGTAASLRYPFTLLEIREK